MDPVTYLAVCYLGFYVAYNKGLIESMPEPLEAIVDQPIGMLALLVIFLILGPTPLAAIKFERRKPGESRFVVDVRADE